MSSSSVHGHVHQWIVDVRERSIKGSLYESIEQVKSRASEKAWQLHIPPRASYRLIVGVAR